MTKKLVWKLPQYLRRHRVTRYQLMQELGENRGRIAYRWSEMPQRIDTEVLLELMSALEKLTGQPVEVTDILDYQNQPETRVEAEAAVWLETNAEDTLERLESLEANLSIKEKKSWQKAIQRAKPARYIPGQGVVVLK
jgi:hypothetical protein